MTGTDPGLLAMVPQPVRAVLLLFPMNIHPRTSPSVDEKVVWHTNQTVRGACGSVGLLHAVMNNTHLISLDEKKFYSQFYESTRDLDSRTRAHRFYENDEIERVHAETAQAEGTVEDSSYSNHSTQTHNLSSFSPFLLICFLCINFEFMAGAGQSLHFTAFVHVNGGLYELDGHNQGPVKHGECDPDNLLPRAAQLIQTNFMDKVDLLALVAFIILY